jgi:hypothetical protein
MNQEIKDKRITCILQAWKVLGEAGFISTDTMCISMPLVEETVKYYLLDMEILKKRYNIPDKIQLHKIAGLLVNAIVKIKPVVPMQNINVFSKDSEIYANEILAIYEGLAICSEYDTEYNITREPWFDEWFDNFVFMLHHRRYTAESLIFIFETVSRICFPNAFSSGN